jgi:hypothetical protein
LIYQIRWATEPGLRGISCSEFRATQLPAGTKPDNEGGVALEFADDEAAGKFVRQLEESFATRRFMNAADAFDTVKAVALEMVRQA